MLCHVSVVLRSWSIHRIPSSTRPWFNFWRLDCVSSSRIGLHEYVSGFFVSMYIGTKPTTICYKSNSIQKMSFSIFRLLCALALIFWASASPAAVPHHLLPRNSTGSQFDPSSRNLAVYYGKAQNTDNPSLYDLCTNSNVDMVVMGFVRQLNGPSALPTFGFTRYCKTPATVTDKSRVYCPDMAANITLCQSMGKKLLISLGGSVSNLTLDSVSDAQEAASILWNVFGAGTASSALRPFGNVAVDGFDFGEIETSF